jgi:queuine tRNA-ribosyltransferase
MLAAQIATLHNLSFYLWLVKEARRHILQGDFVEWKENMIEKVSRRL